MKEGDELESIPRYIEKTLASYCDGRSYMGVLCAVLDLRASIGTELEDTYHPYYTDGAPAYMPFVMLGALVLE
ncbi:hypothetical protein BKN38_01155 [Helicobacter sp. CLO-3]|uniref:hypothetical protein n=1 Tax=unclassified Helicobacter TaxID=2593540 RepID=UPI0008060034|nr:MULTISPECIES: hypothetical protein [unclassified Helicobacter]OBV28553.1 hypothetical protein BA723_08990 [Helicobacter sp. CLO-3]OHU85653.1 hypothetical protein BKN38_01155 [Helicobacter sp. CLO-3]